MKVIVILWAAITLASSAPAEDYGKAIILRYDYEAFKQEGDGYNFIYETSDKQSREEGAEFKGDDEILSVKGTYTYTDDKGRQRDVSYVADENGFRWLQHNQHFEGKRGRSLFGSRSAKNGGKSLNGGLGSSGNKNGLSGNSDAGKGDLFGNVNGNLDGSLGRDGSLGGADGFSNKDKNSLANLDGSQYGLGNLPGSVDGSSHGTDGASNNPNGGSGEFLYIDPNDPKYKGYSKSQLLDLELIEKLKNRERGEGFKGYEIKNTKTTNSIKYYWKEGSLKKLYTDCQKEGLSFQVKLFCDSQNFNA